MSDIDDGNKKEAASEREEIAQPKQESGVSTKGKAEAPEEAEEAPQPKHKDGAKVGAKKGGKDSNSKSKSGKAKRSKRNDGEAEVEAEKVQFPSYDRSTIYNLVRTGEEAGGARKGEGEGEDEGVAYGRATRAVQACAIAAQLPAAPSNGRRQRPVRTPFPALSGMLHV